MVADIRESIMLVIRKQPTSAWISKKNVIHFFIYFAFCILQPMLEYSFFFFMYKSLVILQSVLAIYNFLKLFIFIFSKVLNPQTHLLNSFFKMDLQPINKPSFDIYSFFFIWSLLSNRYVFYSSTLYEKNKNK